MKNYLFHSGIFIIMFFWYSLFALITNVVSYHRINGVSAVCMAEMVCGLEPIGGGNKVLKQN
jgi:hypothetical protein